MAIFRGALAETAREPLADTFSAELTCAHA